MIRARSLMLGCAAALLAASGCGDEPTGGGTASPSPSVRTVDEGVLAVACDVPSPPFAVEGPDGITGLQADLVREVARRLGLEPRLTDVPSFRIPLDVADGTYDGGVVAAPTTPELEQQVDVSEAYFRLTLALVTASEERPDVSTLEDLTLGDVVAVEDGTTAEAFAERSLRPGGVDVRAFPDVDAAYAAVETGLADAVVDQELSATDRLAGRARLGIVDAFSTGESFGIAVRPGHPALLDAVNAALDAMIADGTYEEIYRRYPDLPPGGRVTEAE
jgi:polar amino acid transport system substrate-binding protein